MIQGQGVGTGIEGQVIGAIAAGQAAAEGADRGQDGVVITRCEIDLADVGEGGSIGCAGIGSGDGHEVAVGIEGEAVGPAASAALNALEPREASATAANVDRTVIADVKT